MATHFPPLQKSLFLTLALYASATFPVLSWASPEPIFTEQGAQWTAQKRAAFYTQDQGSRIMPLSWFRALKQLNGKPFLDESLSRYGYLPNDKALTAGLPVGFTTNGDAVGMTCAACHTRQIEVEGKAYRIDGGPALVDFQRFAMDLDVAVAQVLKEEADFKDFAAAVLGSGADAAKQKHLHEALTAWYKPYHTLLHNALPLNQAWGLGRLDAVGMIFNRLAGLDIGTAPDHIIVSNIHRAEAPVRYPFIWNAPIQDKTQWPGFADNGNDVLGLARNLGEVIGVFADFKPKKDDWRVLGVDFLGTNSANFAGLTQLENLVQLIKPPKWPWPVDQSLAAEGKKIFESKTETEGGGCARCHAIRPGALRDLKATWATPLCAVETDEKQFELLTWLVDTGELQGAQIPFLDKPLAAKEPAIRVLGMAVVGSILQKATPLAVSLESKAKIKAAKLESLLGAEKAQKLKHLHADLRQLQSKLLTPQNISLKGAFHLKSTEAVKDPAEAEYPCKDKFDTAFPQKAYESKVMEGIWATAPYLHNGSVPTLAALLEPVAKRPASFKVGPQYDIQQVGLATTQSKFAGELKTTDCSANQSGNSRCGHEFGTQLSAAKKKALLEYLKIL